MMHRTRRRAIQQFAGAATALFALPVMTRATSPQEQKNDAPAQPRASLPSQDPDVVREMVTVSHGNAARVRELVDRIPALANATVDWGFGDWESALGAAAHVGNRPIAELLIARGARVTIFSAAMLGQLDVVRAFIAASPGVQRTLGPHHITLMAHARAGGPAAAAVVKFLEEVGGADVRPSTVPLDPDDRVAILGSYVFGKEPRDRFNVDVRNEQLGIERPGASRRMLFHAGALVFFPSGAPAVKIAFLRDRGDVVGLTVSDPDVIVNARRA